MENRKHIVLLTPGFPESEADSTCIPALQLLVAHLAKNLPDYQFSVIAFQYPFKTRLYNWQGIPVFACGGKGNGGVQRVITWAKAFWQLHKWHRQTPLIGIHSFWLDECTLLGQWFGKIYRIPQISTIMGQDVKPQNKYLSRIDFTRLPVVAPSVFTANLLAKNTGKKVTEIIPIGLKPLPKSASPQKRTIDVLGVGALSPLKNYQLFIDLFARLKKEHPNLRGKIIGDGSEKENLVAQATKLGIADDLVFTGKLPREAVLAEMQQSKILLHPSQYESQGLVLLEALASGMAVVCQNVGFTERSSKMQVCDSKEDMYTALLKLLQSPIDTQPIILQDINQTVSDYQKLYQRF